VGFRAISFYETDFVDFVWIRVLALQVNTTDKEGKQMANVVTPSFTQATYPRFYAFTSWKDAYVLPDDFSQRLWKSQSTRKRNPDSATSQTLANHSVELTQEQHDILAAKYDCKNMTEEEYNQFLDDISEMGLIDPADKILAGYSGGYLKGLTPLFSFAPRASVTSVDDFAETVSCYGVRSDRLEWARFQSTFQTWDSAIASFQSDEQSKMFRIIFNILDQIQ